MAKNQEVITLTREELYEQVWATPMSRLAPQYGLSDVGLAKICKKHRIPRPPLGYWAKKEFGKAPPKPPLPGRSDTGGQKIIIHQAKHNTGGASCADSELRYEDEVMELLFRARQLPKVRADSTLSNPHDLIKVTRKSLELAKPDERGLLWPVRHGRQLPLCVYVSKDSVQRALLIMDALIKIIEELGGDVTVEEDRWHRQTVVRFLGEDAAGIRLRERYNQKKRDPKDKEASWRRYIYTPNGRLVLDSGPSYSHHCYCQDTPKNPRRIESAVNGIVIRIIKEIGETRIRRAEEEEERKRRAEEEKLQLQRKIRRQEEQARVDRLFAEANAWQESRILRKYIEAIRDLAIDRYGHIDEESDFGRWLRWACQQADRLDPLVKSPPSILDNEQ